MNYQEIYGDLITLAKQGKFDVIAHGCNCFCRMKRGIAPQMAEAFGCDKFPLEQTHRVLQYALFEGEDTVTILTGNEGNINKLGQIEFQQVHFLNGVKYGGYSIPKPEGLVSFYVVNAYTQYQWGTELKPFDYDAFTLCMRKMNHKFKGMHIGLPQIGSHLAGGVWDVTKLPKAEQITALPEGQLFDIKTIIQRELKDCNVTIVIYKP